MIHPLRLMRLQKGFSQYALGYKASVPQVYISLAERGFPSLSHRNKQRLAAVLECTVEEIFPIDEEERIGSDSDRDEEQYGNSNPKRGEATSTERGGV